MDRKRQKKAKRNPLWTVFVLVLVLLGILWGNGVAGGGTEAVDTGQTVASDTGQTAGMPENTRQAAEPTDDAGQGGMSVHFLDVGQGTSVLVLCDGEALLYDCGDNSQGTRVQNYLRKQGVGEIKYLIGSHPDADHIGGMDVIVTKFDCGTILMPDKESDTNTYRDVIDAVEYRNYKVTNPAVGDTCALGGATVTILGPAALHSDSNDCSIAVKITYGDTAFVFTGDAEEAEEREICASGIDLAANVYLAGHHGGRNASSEELLAAIDPDYAVISCGEDNSYGHPSAEVLNRLRGMGIQMFRTDDQGTIVATTDGETITWNVSPSDNWTPGEPK